MMDSKVSSWYNFLSSNRRSRDQSPPKPKNQFVFWLDDDEQLSNSILSMI